MHRSTTITIEAQSVSTYKTRGDVSSLSTLILILVLTHLFIPSGQLLLEVETLKSDLAKMEVYTVQAATFCCVFLILCLESGLFLNLIALPNRAVVA
jgi:hypothetical protein